jgi:hypothetical protein
MNAVLKCPIVSFSYRAGYFGLYNSNVNCQAR